MQPQEFLALVQNTDPDLKVAMEKVFTPQGTGPVATSPHFVYILCNILRGFTPREVSEMVEREKKAFITVDSVREYMMLYVPPGLMLSNLKQRWIQRAAKVDEISLLENLCYVQMMRVMERLDKPSVDAEDDESKRRDVDVMRKLAMDTLKAKIETGRYDKPAEKIAVTVTSSSEVTHTHKSDPTGMPDVRAAAAALEALKTIAMMARSPKDEGDAPIH